MSQIKVPLFQVIFDEDGFFYIYKFNFIERCHIKIENSRYLTYEDAKRVVEELNQQPDNKPIVMDLDID